MNCIYQQVKLKDGRKQLVSCGKEADRRCVGCEEPYCGRHARYHHCAKQWEEIHATATA